MFTAPGALSLGLSGLSDLCQHLVEVSAPAGGVFTLSMAANGGPIEDRFDAPTKP